ncbi:hypothetical protein V8F33_007534 [Rhypophila sp. PSN 637]
MPLAVTFPVSNSVPFCLPLLDIPVFSHNITVSFKDGTHLFSSPDFKIGTDYTHGERAIFGRLVFRYTYDSCNQCITVCGTDYPSADGMSLISHPEGSESQEEEDTCVEHAAENVGFPADELHGRRSWNYHSQLMPGAAKVIKTIVRDANEALLAALKCFTAADTPTPVSVITRSLPPILPLPIYHSLTSVHRDGKFLETYDPTKTYLAIDRINPIDSTYKGTKDLTEGWEFANVIGSTDDPHIDDRSWINLWEWACKEDPELCTSYKFEKFDCDDKLLGGHVIAGQHAITVDKGSNDVLIVPICTGHNNDDKRYMSVIENFKAVVLGNYMGS